MPPTFCCVLGLQLTTNYCFNVSLLLLCDNEDLLLGSLPRGLVPAPCVGRVQQPGEGTVLRAAVLPGGVFCCGAALPAVSG